MAAVVLLGAAGQAARSAAGPAPAVPAPSPDGPLRVGGEVKPPVKISGDQPAYTEAARRARVTGIVILEAVIDEHGEVTTVRVLKGLPMGLDDAAVDAVKTWKFTPAKRLGEPVPVYYILTVNFQIQAEFTFGPAFVAFLRDHAEVRALVEEDDFAEAGALIDRWAAERPADETLRLGRAYMHVGAGELEDAWRVAQSVSGPEGGEVALSIAAKAVELLRANPGAPAEDRSETVELGVAAARLAAERIDDEDGEAVAYALRTTAELLRAQSELVTDRARRQALLDEAKALEARADAPRPPGAPLH